jgi:hypothetical protein
MSKKSKVHRAMHLPVDPAIKFTAPFLNRRSLITSLKFRTFSSVLLASRVQLNAAFLKPM